VLMSSYALEISDKLIVNYDMKDNKKAQLTQRERATAVHV